MVRLNFEFVLNQQDVKQPLRFPGQVEDGETGFYYNYHRYYNPETGSYTQPDPIGLAGGINPYVYANNNPIMNVDSSGLETVVIHIESGKGGLIPHSSVYVKSKSQQFLYDPAGSYLPPSKIPKGSGDFYKGKDASLQDYVAYWENKGSKVNTYSINTNELQEENIINRLVSQGVGIGGFCAGNVFSVLSGVCGIKSSMWPNQLGINASKAKCN